jgi:hypothetical protein
MGKKESESGKFDGAAERFRNLNKIEASLQKSKEIKEAEPDNKEKPNENTVLDSDTKQLIKAASSFKISNEEKAQLEPAFFLDDNKISLDLEGQEIREKTHTSNITEVNKNSVSELYEEFKQLKDDITKTSSLDLIAVTAIDTDEKGLLKLTAARNARIKPDKIYLNEAKGLRVKFDKKAVTLYLNQGEKLGDIIYSLPHGIIDKKVTGVGATTLELKAKRNSIIVMPTKALAYCKYNAMQDALYVGSSYSELIQPSINDILDYIKNNNIQYKKIIVIADSLTKLIKAIEKVDKNIYENYFLMIDEVDSLQYSNNYRPNISNTVDHYLKFKRHNRALVSATINEFSHPELKKESLTIFRYKETFKRKVQLSYTNRINELLANKVISIVNATDDKIAIAYNSISNILYTIKLLPLEIQNQCGVLCSDMSQADVGEYYTLTHNGVLEKKITFMTSSYFSGIDIYDKCHLITISNIEKPFSTLILNTITQIHGRFRNGLLSDSIIHNSFKEKTDKKWIYNNINKYRESLIYKAEKVIEFVDSINNLLQTNKEKDARINLDLFNLFERIKDLIREKATEKLLGREEYTLIRKNTQNRNEIAYFNIDAACEKMRAYSKLYSKSDAFKLLLENKHIVSFSEESFEDINTPKAGIKDIIYNNEIRANLIKLKETLIELLSQRRLDNSALYKLSLEAQSKYEKEFINRIRKHYEYIKVDILADRLIDIVFENSKSYRSLNNTIAFWILDENHPFKCNIIRSFEIDKKYNSIEIGKILQPIIEYHFNRKLSKARLVNIFNSYFKCTYTGGKYLVKKDNPLDLPEPMKKVAPYETKLTDYFVI